MGSGTSHRRSLTLLAAGICVFNILLFLPALQNDFVSLDDRAYVTQNPALQMPFGKFVWWSLRAFHAGNWHPLTLFSYRLDFALWGLDPWGYHLTNILLHSLNGLLVLILAWQLLLHHHPNSPRAVLVSALVVALLFSLHPLHVESVAWVSERKDVLFAFFWLLAAISYMARFRSMRPENWYAASVVFFALSALSKPMAVTFPAVLLLIDLYPLRRLQLEVREFLRVVAEKIPFLIVAALCVWATVAAQTQGHAIVSLEKISLAARLSSAAGAVFFYLGKTFYPNPLVPFYPLIGDGLQGPFTPQLFAFLAISLLAITAVFRYPWVATVWFSFVVLLLPVLGLVQVGSQFAADRYMYLPLLVPLLLASESLILLFGQGRAVVSTWRSTSFALLVLILVVVLGVLTRAQIGVWKDSFSLWDHIIEHNPENARGLYARADLLVEVGRYEEAIRDYDRLIEIESTRRLVYAPMGVYYAARARAYQLLGNEEAAQADYRRAFHGMAPHRGKP